MTARLTGDAIVATVKDDKQVVNFSVALNDSYKPKGGELKRIVTYYQCAYWINPRIAQFLKKGSIVEMEGRISVNAYKNVDGEAKASLPRISPKFSVTRFAPSLSNSVFDNS